MKILSTAILAAISCACMTLNAQAQNSQDSTHWRGLTLAPEHRCSPYDRKAHYHHYQSVEVEIIAAMNGQIYGPYSGKTFASKRETDIEHIIAASEAHDSGLCVAPIHIRQQYANDLLNLTLAAPHLNRRQKKAKDAAEWVPEKNKCWFANRVLQVRLKYNLTIDRKEARALEAIISKCDTYSMIFYNQPSDGSYVSITPDVIKPKKDPISLYDSNRNGRITCKEARAHGIAPVRAFHAAYEYMNDHDSDGVVCE